jgi:DNA polymerase V
MSTTRKLHSIELRPIEYGPPLLLPLATQGIVAGFPSPAQDYLELAIDLNKLLIKHPEATFFGRVKGMSMQDEHIREGDVLIIDRSLPPTDGAIALCWLDGDFTVKRLQKKGDRLWLVPANPAFNPIEVKPEQDFLVWGIVTYVIKSVRL